VIILHGMGYPQRNLALGEAVNAVTYWLNHKAGLALRTTGSGRVWLRTKLTHDDDPDAPASRATLDVVAPAQPGAATNGQADGLRLEWREVWWARSFGLPPVNSALKWTRLFFFRGVYRIFFTRRFRISVPGHARPPRGHLAGIGRWIGRIMLAIVLFIYDLLQTILKSAQWLLGIPLLLGALAIGSVLRKLSVIPGFGTLARILPALLDPTSLRWVASAQLYLQDYTRSDSLRRRFDREVEYFSRDPNCQRIVVIAHSIGTAMAYEGLTDTLPREQAAGYEKPVTFICMAQMLGRVWSLSRTEPHRLRGVLPKSVRWLHFWARFDPLVTGSFNARSLPPMRDWPVGEGANPDDAIRASLAHCHNETVVNVDSFLHDHDHGSYWGNLEQVVGPITRELVAGNSALQQLVEAHQATLDEVLARRWQVAWTSTIALIGGGAAGTAVYSLEQGHKMGPATLQAVRDLFAAGLQLPLFLGLIWQKAALLLGNLGGAIHQLAVTVLGQSLVGAIASQIPPVTEQVIDISIALIVTALIVERLALVLAPSDPFVFHPPRYRVRGAAAPYLPPKAEQAQRVPVGVGVGAASARSAEGA
jgi:hypothetical protein